METNSARRVAARTISHPPASETHSRTGRKAATRKTDNPPGGADDEQHSLDEAQTTLRLIDGWHDDDDHETAFSPEEIAIEEGHMTRIETTAGQLATAMSTGVSGRPKERHSGRDVDHNM